MIPPTTAPVLTPPEGFGDAVGFMVAEEVACVFGVDEVVGFIGLEGERVGSELV